MWSVVELRQVGGRINCFWWNTVIVAFSLSWTSHGFAIPLSNLILVGVLLLLLLLIALHEVGHSSSIKHLLGVLLVLSPSAVRNVHIGPLRNRRVLQHLVGCTDSWGGYTRNCMLMLLLLELVVESLELITLAALVEARVDISSQRHFGREPVD